MEAGSGTWGERECSGARAIDALGPRVRAVMAELRWRASHARPPEMRIPHDAEARLLRAVQQDEELARARPGWLRREPSPFEFGIHALLEIARMRLLPRDAERLATAMRDDLGYAASRFLG